MNPLFKVFRILAFILMRYFKIQSVRYLKIQGAKLYLKTIAQMRAILLVIFISFVCSLLIIAGLLAVLASAFYLLPLDAETKAWIILGMGAFAALGSFFTLTFIHSEEAWLKRTHASDVVRRALK